LIVYFIFFIVSDALWAGRSQSPGLTALPICSIAVKGVKSYEL